LATEKTKVSSQIRSLRNLLTVWFPCRPDSSDGGDGDDLKEGKDLIDYGCAFTRLGEPFSKIHVIVESAIQILSEASKEDEDEDIEPQLDGKAA
jgi:hypothetical protein